MVDTKLGHQRAVSASQAVGFSSQELITEQSFTQSDDLAGRFMADQMRLSGQPLTASQQQHDSKSQRLSKSSSVVVYNSVIAPDVKGKVSKMYRIETTPDSQQPSKKRLVREQLKTVAFFVADISTTIYALVVLFLEYQDWEKCVKKFNLWLISVIITSTISTIFDFWSWSLLRRKKKNSQVALTN